MAPGPITILTAPAWQISLTLLSALTAIIADLGVPMALPELEQGLITPPALVLVAMEPVPPALLVMVPALRPIMDPIAPIWQISLTLVSTLTSTIVEPVPTALLVLGYLGFAIQMAPPGPLPTPQAHTRVTY